MIIVASILIVEDDISLQSLYQKIISFTGHEVIEIANNGEEAIEKFKSLKPDLIIMDHRMPVKNGIEATKEIVKIDKTARIIFASADQSIKTEALAEGAILFKEKPFSVEDLLDSIEKSLK